MTWLAIAVMGSVCFMQTQRWTLHAQGNVTLVGWVNYTLAACFFGAVLALYWPNVLDWPVVGLGLITGILYATNYFLSTAVIRRIGLGLSAATIALSVVVPVLVSIAFGDPWLDRSTGLAVALLALPMIALAGDQASPTKPVKGIARSAWVTGLFLAAGAETTLIKISREIGGEGFELLFLPALFGAAAVAASPPVLLMRAKFRLGDVVRGVILGLSNIVGNYAMTLAVQTMSGPVVFPLKTTLVVLSTALLGWLLWRERLSTMALFGIGLALLATVMLAWSDLTAAAGV
jgi:multidrug transporter EmrE-like cation transporter